MRRQLLTTLLLGSAVIPTLHAATGDRPNLVLILADDLGYGDLACYGNTKIKTPNLDRMAAEGLRFTRAYSAASVCSPSRASLLTGLHQGHAPIRANHEVPGGQRPLPAGTKTLAHTLQAAGYDTACFGKWGMGPIDSEGSPTKMGFGTFFGYADQAHAHDYYPQYLDDGAKRLPLDGKTYSADLIAKRQAAWLKAPHAKPFFLFHATTLPHLRLQVPDTAAYDTTGWTPAQKKYATMVSTLDRHVGEVLTLLKETGHDRDTLVIVTSDNGPDDANRVYTFFDSAGGLRGVKRGMYEGSLRMPLIARWPGRVPAGKTSDTPVALYDLHATFAALAKQKAPANDGLDLSPLLLGGPAPKRDALYFELHEPNFRSALLRADGLKVVVPHEGAAPELYDLAADPAEKTNLAESRPSDLQALLTRMRTEHTPYATPAGGAAKRKK